MARQPTPKGTADRSSDVFMREVDDAVRQDDLQSFFTRYGLWIAAVIVIALAALAGWIFWQNEQEEQAGVRSEEYIAALDSISRNNLEGADSALEPLAEADQDGYRAAARMMRAHIASEQNDAKAMTAGYQALSGDKDAPQAYRDLALLRQTAAQFDTLKPQTVIERMQPLAQADSPWFGSAAELVALATLEMGQKDKAGQLFADIAENEGVPSSIRSRTRQMAGVLGVDVVVPGENDNIVPEDGAIADMATAGEGTDE